MESNTNDHVLIIEDDGNWRCSCGHWGSGYLGSIHGAHCQRHGITEVTVRDWHASHANAIIIQL
jgi:hypothetical protein